MNTRSFLKTLTASALAPAGAMALSTPPLSLEQWESRMKKKLEVIKSHHAELVFGDKKALVPSGWGASVFFMSSWDLTPLEENEDSFRQFFKLVNILANGLTERKSHLVLDFIRPSPSDGPESYFWVAVAEKVCPVSEAWKSICALYPPHEGRHYSSLYTQMLHADKTLTLIPA